MTHDTAQDIIDRMDQLLDEERRALLDGDLEAVGTLMERKGAMIDALNALDPGATNRAQSLKSKAQRNQALLDGALEGMRLVTGRLTALRRIRRTLETYDRSGQKTSVSDVIEHKVEKRA